MIEGMAAVQARILELQTLVGGHPLGRAMAAGAVGAGGSTGAGSTAGTASSPTSGANPSFDDLIAKLKKAGETGTTPGAAPAGSPTRAGGGNTGTAERVISGAKKYLGTPYLWGGTDPAQGLDCSGLVQRVFREVGIDLPRVSRDQAKAGTAVPSLKEARPGDLVFFHSPVSHVGIYLGDGKMLDAPKRGDVVKIQKVWATPSHIRRVLPDGPAASGAVTATRGTSADAALSGPYADLFVAAGRRHGVDPALLSAVAKNESGYRPNAVSHAGARGLMQIMPATARGLGVDPMDPKQAVDGAARLLSGYLEDYDGSVKLALAAYNAGPGAVRRYDGVPPYRETQTYVTRVTDTWKELR